MDEQRTGVDGIDQKLLRGGEVTLGFEVEAGEARVVQNSFGGGVAIQGDQMVMGGFDGGWLAGALDERTAQGGGGEACGETGGGQTAPQQG